MIDRSYVRESSAVTRIAVRFAPIWQLTGSGRRPLCVRSVCRINPAGKAYSIWMTFPCQTANSALTATAAKRRGRILTARS